MFSEKYERSRVYSESKKKEQKHTNPHPPKETDTKNGFFA